MVTRRTILTRASLAAAGALASPAILHWPANAAEFAYKYGTALPDGHPMVIRSKEAAAKIKEESGGKLDITFYTEQRPRPGHRDDVAGDRRRAGNLWHVDRHARRRRALRRRFSASALPLPITIRPGRRWTAISATIAAISRKRSASIAWTRPSTMGSARSR